MLVPLEWLKEYVDVSLSTEKLADIISLSAIGVKEVGKDYLDLEVTYNRGDLLSIIGVAREVAVLTNKPLLWKSLRERSFSGKSSVSASVISKGCSYYSIVSIESVKNGESPQWMRERLTKAGMRPLNLLVDITNYVMLEYGQPLHAFDASKIHNNSFVVRDAKKGERFVTLDGKKHTLDTGMIMIADGKESVAIGGVMGGLDTEVSANTSSLFLEAALFDPTAIRTTSKRLGLQSEASNRFVHMPSVYMLEQARLRAISLYETLAGGKAVELVLVSNLREERQKIKVNSREIERMLGISLTCDRAVSILKQLSFDTFEKQTDDGYTLTVTAPDFRHDITGSHDVIEELARIYGYDQLLSELPIGAVPPYKEDTYERMTDIIRITLRGLGYHEAISYSFSAPSAIQPFFELPDCVKIANPISSETEYMRPTLLSNLITIVRANGAHSSNLQFFEIGKIYRKSRGALPLETRSIGIVYTDQSIDNPYYLLKTAVEYLLSDIGIEIFTIAPIDSHSYLHPGRKSVITIGKNVVGYMGELHPDIASQFGVSPRVAVLEINLDMLISFSSHVRSYKPISSYPPVIEDVSVVGSAKILTADIVSGIKKQSSLIANVTLTDTYNDSRTFRIIYQDRKGTLSDRDVEKIRGKIISYLEKTLSLTVRKLS